MKLRSPEDRMSFLMDINRLDLMNESMEEIPAELYEVFLNRRRSLVRHLADFRKSQIARSSWNQHRWKHLRGIRRWHRGLEGKRFHRSLGRFVATHIFRTKRPELGLLRGMRDDQTRMRYNTLKEGVEARTDLTYNVSEVLKAISSVRTHMYIESEYYTPLEEQVDLIVLLEYAIPILTQLEMSLLQEFLTGTVYDPTDEELELLVRLTDTGYVWRGFAEIGGSDAKEVQSIYESFHVDDDDASTYYSELYRRVVPLIHQTQELHDAAV